MSAFSQAVSQHSSRSSAPCFSDKADDTWEKAKVELDDLDDKVDGMKDKLDRDEDDARRDETTVSRPA